MAELSRGVVEVEEQHHPVEGEVVSLPDQVPDQVLDQWLVGLAGCSTGT